MVFYGIASMIALFEKSFPCKCKRGLFFDLHVSVRPDCLVKYKNLVMLQHQWSKKFILKLVVGPEGTNHSHPRVNILVIKSQFNRYGFVVCTE